MKKGPGRRPSGAVAEGLKKALMNELDGREFYRMAAGNAAAGSNLALAPTSPYATSIEDYIARHK